MLVWIYWDYTDRLTLIPPARGQSRQWAERNWGKDVVSDRRVETKLCRRERIGWILPPWLQGVEEAWAEPGTSVSVCLQVCWYAKPTKTKSTDNVSHHYLEHRAEDLGVLRHAAYVELPGEDGRVVILIVHLNKHLGCVSCKKQMVQISIQKNWDTQSPQNLYHHAINCPIYRSLQSSKLALINCCTI